MDDYIIKAHNETPKTEKIRCFFSCSCMLCYQQMISHYKPTPKKTQAKTDNVDSKDFKWLLEQIGMLNSLDLLIPETVIFENGTAALILYCYRENRVKYTTNENKLKPHEIMKIFTQTVRERKKIEKSRTDEIYKFTSLNAHQDSGNGKEIALLRYNGPLKTLRVMREPEFLNLIYERAGSNTWKNIDYLQTVLKSKAGIGDSVFVKYNQTDIDKSQVCLDKCMTLINSLKQKGIDISQMKAEFQLDDDGKYWFCHATGIKANKLVPLPKINKLRGLRMRPESREKLMYTLDAHMKKSKTTKHKEYESMMDACFENVKDKTGCNKTIDYKMLFDIPSRELPFRAPEYDRKPNQTSREIDPWNTSRARLRQNKIKSKSHSTNEPRMTKFKLKELILKGFLQ